MDKKQGKLQRWARMLYWFLFKDDGWASFIVNTILIVLLVKFVVFPVLGFALGTTHPIVAVISGSMNHEGQNFDAWWQSTCCRGENCQEERVQGELYGGYNITKEQFLLFPLHNGFKKGDLIVLRGAKNIGAGDVVVFPTQYLSEPVIHRVVKVNATALSTKGDSKNNCGIGYFEENIPREQVIGKAWFKLPYLGYVKIIFVELLQKLRG